MECYCVARKEAARCEKTKQTAMVMSLWFWDFFTCLELYWDWQLLHNWPARIKSMCWQIFDLHSNKIFRHAYACTFSYFWWWSFLLHFSFFSHVKLDSPSWHVTHKPFAALFFAFTWQIIKHFENIWLALYFYLVLATNHLHTWKIRLIFKTILA